MPNVPKIDLSSYLIDQKTLEFVPGALAKKYKLIPLFKIGHTLTVAMADPSNILAIDDLRSHTGLDIDIVTASAEDVLQSISQYYGLAADLDALVQEAGKTQTMSAVKAAEEVPVIKLVNLVIVQAMAEKASDIHIEPEEKYIRIRFRVDGVLHEEAEIPLAIHTAIISRIKIMAGMDIAETRIPQDGRLAMNAEGKEVDVRVSTYPSVLGEKVVMRLLDKGSMSLGLTDLGFLKADLDKFKEIIKRPYGMILVTGPTGSGKTTTLYAALSTLNSLDKNIITIEDPVEYEIDGITQSQVNVKAGLTFANALRSIVRQDPDVVLVGEIRDLETARIAVQAAMTGHLVFSTLHTNDAAGAITRLIDMGVEPFLVSSSVAAVIAQRLIRTICPSCKGKGCKVCHHSKYKGRLGIFEQLIVDENIRTLINKKASADEIKKQAVTAGMKTLHDDGMAKIAQKITTEEEVVRVTALD